MHCFQPHATTSTRAMRLFTCCAQARSHACFFFGCFFRELQQEWWLGPASGDAADTKGWRRPFRLTHAAPHDAFLMAQPANIDGMMLWVGIGKVYTLSQHRLAGIYAPANGEFASPAFALPAGATPARPGIFLNAAARWHGLLETGACDEGCNAYIFAELTDATTGAVIPGYEREWFSTLTDVDGTALVLRWAKVPASASSPAGAASASAAATRSVRLRLFFRDATVYSVRIGSE